MLLVKTNPPHLKSVWTIAILKLLLLWGVFPNVASAQAQLPRVTQVLTYSGVVPGKTTLTETGFVTMTATMDTTATDTVTVTISVAPANLAGHFFATTDDYVVSENKVLTFVPGSRVSTGTVTVTAVDDGGVKKLQRRIRITFTASSNARMASNGNPSSTNEFYIKDDELDPTKSVVLSPATISENGGVARVTAKLSHPTHYGDVTLNVITSLYPAGSPGRADDSDFMLSDSTRLVIPKGKTESTGTVTVTAVDNNVVGPAQKRMKVTVLNTNRINVATEPGLLAPWVQLRIGDDDRPVTASLESDPNPMVDEGGSVKFTARLSEAPPLDVTIPLVMTSVTAERGDYSTLESLTVKGGKTTGTGTVTTIVDADKDDETFTVAVGTLPHGFAQGIPALIKVKIRDHTPPPNRDPTVTISCDPCVVGRGEMVRLTTNASDPEGDPLTYAWSARAGAFEGPVDRWTANWTAPDEFGRYTIRVRVSDGQGGSATAWVRVEVVNLAPAFAQPVYHLSLPENEDGRLGPVELGQAAAEDPDGDALTYDIVSGDRDRFAVDAQDGAVRYIGPGEDFETEPNRFELTVRVRDEFDAETDAQVVVTVSDANELPAVSAVCDPCSVARGGEVRLTSTATDPDGDALSYAWSAEKGSFAGPTDGVGARWIAPAELGAMTIQVRVSDGRGFSASTDIEVEVVNRAPAFEQPEFRFELPENRDGQGQPVDLGRAAARDPDGDALTYEVTSGDRTRFAIEAGGGALTYVGPGEDFEVAPNRFELTVRVQDGFGGHATAEVVVEVTDVNERPFAVGSIPDQALDEGGGTAEVDLSSFFGDADGDALTYAARTSDGEVVRVATAGTILTLAPLAYGSATVEITAEDPGGLRATQTLRVGVSDRPQRAVLEHLLAATARGYIASVRSALGQRTVAAPCEPSRLSVMGRSVPLGRESATTMLEATRYRARSAAAALGLGAGTEGPSNGTGAHAPLERGSARNVAEQWSAGIQSIPAQVLGLNRNGGGTDFLLSWGGGEQDVDECPDRGRWSVWGQGDAQRFEGTPSVQGYDASYDGERTTGYVGIDAGLGDHWLAGVALSRSRSVGDWRVGASNGRLTQTMTAVHPYLRWTAGATSVWASAGAGMGEAENLRGAGRLGTSATKLRIGLVELRQRFGAPGGLDFSLLGDAAWAELRTEDGTETVDGQDVRVDQIRLGADLSMPMRLGGAAITPFGSVYARRDGGAGQTGDGAEAAGGLRAVLGIVRFDAQARILARHSAAGYNERGAALTLAVGRPGGEGLSLAVSPRWGDAATGAGSLWSGSLGRGPLGSRDPGADRADHTDRWTLDAHGSYGIKLSDGRRLDLLGSYGAATGASIVLRLGLSR